MFIGSHQGSADLSSSYRATPGRVRFIQLQGHTREGQVYPVTGSHQGRTGLSSYRVTPGKDRFIQLQGHTRKGTTKLTSQVKV